MNSSIAASQAVRHTKNPESATGVAVERRRVDVTGLPAERVAEYLQVAGEREDVYFERRAGKTYAVARDGR